MWRFLFERKGQWKNRSNNPRRPDGVIHEYCPPELVPEEMERFFDNYKDIRERDYPVEVEAAWLHHRFVRTHPFQDGNGRISRLLMAYPYLKRGLPPPVVPTESKPVYIDALEAADASDLRGFADYIGDLAQIALRGSLQIGRRALRGDLERPNGNGGRTVGERYYPPKGKERGARARLTGWPREGPTPNEVPSVHGNPRLVLTGRHGSGGFNGRRAQHSVRYRTVSVGTR